MIQGDRIRERLKVLKRSQGWLARAVELSPQAISKMANGGTSETPKLYQIARALGTTVEYLSGESEKTSAAVTEKHSAYRAQPDDERPAKPARTDLVNVPELDLRYGMGATNVDVPIGKTMRQFSRSWLRQFTNARPEDLAWAQGIGDSMTPTFLDSDLLLIDTSDTDIAISDKFWAIAYGNSGMVKRLRPMPDGSVKIISDKPGLSEERAYDGEMHVIGRIAALVRKM